MKEEERSKVGHKSDGGREAKEEAEGKKGVEEIGRALGVKGNGSRERGDEEDERVGEVEAERFVEFEAPRLPAEPEEGVDGLVIEREEGREEEGGEREGEGLVDTK